MLFRKNLQPRCEYCQSGTSLGFGEVICIRRGIVSENFMCGYFRYEPTKREPEYARSIKAPDIASFEDDTVATG